jgi:hypothetical protein
MHFPKMGPRMRILMSAGNATFIAGLAAAVTFLGVYLFANGVLG